MVSPLGVVLAHPARVVATGFAVAVAVGTFLLALPIAWTGPGGAPLVTALFHATSAVCVTGLATVDTGGSWSGFGEIVLVGLVQVGGIGIMTLASIVAVVVADRLGLRAKAMTQAEIGVEAPDVRRTLAGVVRYSAIFEGAVALVLGVRGMWAYDMSPLEAVRFGVFHSITAFNNAGFALLPDNLVQYAADWWVNVPVMVAVVAGGIGFPVLDEIFTKRRREWTLHTRLTLSVTGMLLVIGTVSVLLFEWSNPSTLGSFDVVQKSLAAMFHSVSTRTAGFNTVDVGGMHEATWLITILLMLIGSGVASTGGGIKVTTFAVLVLVCWAEIRGDQEVTYRRRTIPVEVQRQALVTTLGSVATVMVGTFLLLLESPVLLDRVLFEAVSAFGTVGLSTGITASFGTLGQLTLVALMYLGRIGPTTLGVALVLRQRERLYRYPEGRPLVG